MVTSLLGAPAPPAVRKPALEVRFGSGSASEWARAVSFVTVELGIAPAVDVVEVALAPGQHAPAVAVGDTGSVSLGYAGALTAVFAGTVASVRRSIDGATRVVATDAAGALARLRVNQSYEQLSAGEIVSELAGRAGVTPATLADGISFPFYVVDDGRSLWTHVATLARACGFTASVDGAGGLVFGPPQTTPVRKFTYGSDVLMLQAARAAPSLGAVTVVGEGAAGSDGSDAWNWLVHDSSGVTRSAGSGEPKRLVRDASLRSADAAQTAADAASAAAQSAVVTGRVAVPGAPDVTAGCTIEIAGAPEPELNGVCTVRTLRHRFAKRGGFVTTIDFGRAP
jgi:phage protein D